MCPLSAHNAAFFFKEKNSTSLNTIVIVLKLDCAVHFTNSGFGMRGGEGGDAVRLLPW